MELSQIHQPSDIRQLSLAECTELADDIRTKIIQTVSKNGGHLSSNLGMVEITLALHRVFNTPEDQLVFDVGHQTYAHKLLTGRYDRFDSLRTFGGISGFPKCVESEYDCFEVGHASTAISAALGMARARDELGQKHHVVAVVGDGALTGGMCYEALNDCGNSKTRLILILNDNEMSIAKNVGALSHHLSELRTSTRWTGTKRKVKSGLQKLPYIGAPLHAFIHKIKKGVKSLLMDEGFFTTLGFQYVGPIDGHDIASLEKIFERAKDFDEPLVIHCATKKGFGYYSAERKPEAFHGAPPFLIENGEWQSSGRKSNGEVATDALIALAEEDKRIAAITAAMPLGTCSDRFQAVFPTRFWDVGIAEEHAVTLCAGMAKGGLRPFFYVYSTFLQRGYDQVMIDVCVQNLPVTLLIDRAGLPNEDGQSHQGLFDLAYLRHMPNMTVLAPADANELEAMIRAAHALNAPCAIRYSKNATVLPDDCKTTPFTIGQWKTLRDGSDGVLLAVGSMVQTALWVADTVSDEGIELKVINASTVKPLDEGCLLECADLNIPVFTLEEHVKTGGFGSAVLEYYAAHERKVGVTLIGVDEQFVPQGDHLSLLRLVKLDGQSVAATVREKLGMPPQEENK